MSIDANVLRLLRVFEQDSDEDHILTMSQIVSNLKANGASEHTDRRAVYTLVDTLLAFD